jgi:hypothetical protein
MFEHDPILHIPADTVSVPIDPTNKALGLIQSEFTADEVTLFEKAQAPFDSEKLSNLAAVGDSTLRHAPMIPGGGMLASRESTIMQVRLFLEYAQNVIHPPAYIYPPRREVKVAFILAQRQLRRFAKPAPKQN